MLSEKAIISGLTESCTKGGHELINNERCTTCDHSFFRYTTNDRRMVSLAPNMDFGAKMLSHTIDNTGNCTIEFETPITQIPDGAFKNTSINNYFLRIPSSVATIGAYAFANTSITGTLTFQDVTEIGEGAFENCKNISYLNFGFSLKKIGDKAFNGCTFPINLSIPNTVTEIGNYAFYKCGEIRKLTLPTSLERIGSYAFADCKNIGGNLLIPSSVKEIGDGAFSNCIGFFGTLEMTHPSRIDNLIKIGKEAFAGVRNITGALMIPNTVKEIGDGAFRGCISFDKHLTLSKNLTKIGKEAFSGCKKLIGNLSIPNTVTEIGDNAFYGCEGLNAYLTISDKLQRIGNYVFYGCSRLIGGLTIPNSVTEIGDYAFYNCGGLNGNLTLPTNLKKIGDKAFASCSKLHCEELVLPATLESFGEDVFQGNPLIKRLVFQSLPKGISNNIWNAPKLNKYVSLSDASYINDIAPYQVKEASYSRTMSNTWGTLVLPYKMTLTGNEPYSLFVIDHITPNELVLRRLSGEVKAGTACVVRRDGEQQTMIFTANDATLNTTMQPTAAVEGLNFQGTYHAKEVNNGYIIRNGLLWDVAKLKAASPQTEAIMVGPFRSWLDGTITNSAAKLSIRVDDSATGIDNPISSLNADDVEYYDLNGRRLTAPQQGINIMKRGNKTMKVIIK